jgi:hypothetical protein
MRSFLIVFGTALVVGTAFALYWTIQPKSHAQTASTAPVIPAGVVVQPGGSGLGDGQRPWVFNYDGGILKSQFTAANYKPQPDGSILVDRPVTVFYQGGGKIVVLTGDTGVLDPPPGGAPKPGNASSAMPGTMSMTSRNGRLHAVVINAYPTVNSVVPTMTIVTDNIRYDSDTLQLFTDKYTDAGGHVVPADQVPVTERGDDYDFDGRGLTIRWNGKTHRMQQLKVAHGQKLVVKHPSHMGLPANADTGSALNGVETPVLSEARGPGFLAAGPAFGHTSGPAFAEPGSPMLASTDRRAVQLVAATATATASAATPVCHRAVFNDDVQVFQGDHRSATADLMLADFVDGGSGDDSKKGRVTAAAAAHAPATVADQPFVPPTAYSAPPAALKAAALPSGASTQPAAAPVVAPIPAATATSQPAKGPITVTWTGELSVSELDTEPMMPLLSGQSVVRLVGSPTVLTPAGSTVTAARATYRTGDGALLAEPSAKVPEVVLVQDKGVTLHTKRVAFDPATSVATLGGVSRLDVPQKKGLPMVVTWDRVGLLHLADKPPGAPGERADPGAVPELGEVDAVDLSGHVAVDRPSFSMRSRTLHLELQPVPGQDSTKKSDDDSPATAPKRMLATGDVRAWFTGTGGKTQGIDADKLDVRLGRDAAGKSFPNGVRADGNVVAMDTDQTMTAKHLEAVLAEKVSTAAAVPAAAPTTAPADDDPGAAVDLVSLLSTGDVHALTKAGATADSQNLRVTTVDGIRQVELWGNGGAVVNDGRGKTLTGSVLHLSPDRGTASVDGAGTIHSVAGAGAAAQTASSTTRPADVSWTDSMSMDSVRNSVEVVGRVEVKIQESDGGIDIFTGDRAHLDLENAAKKPADDSAVAAGDDVQPAMGSKQVRRLIMNGHVVGDSVLSAGGKVVRQAHVVGNKLIYTTVDGRAEIPGPGQLLIVNHKPDTPAAGAVDPNTAAEKPGGNRGSMAVAWTHSLIYSDTLNQIDITGGVRAGFSPDSSSKPDKSPRDTTPMRLESDELLITLKKTAPAETGSSAAPKPGDDDQSRVQIEKATAIGAVHFIAHGGDVWCHTADFDPAAERMTAHGSDAEPGRASQLPGKTGGSFDGTFVELVFDTSSEEVVSVKGMGGVMRK